MAKIQILSESMIRKIAAGEVIERPASVVKELVENALDAAARRVDITVREGGRQGITVSDDGSGIAREDVELCAERHATSKMRAPTDLFGIATLGFRGEALASIGAVSRLEIETRTAGNEEGTRLVIEGGVRRELAGIGRDLGTTVSVRNIFYNTPARRKFLRHVETEMRHITRAVVQLAASSPEVAFRLVHQDRELLHYLPAERQERAGELLGLDPEDLLGVEGQGEGMSVHGLVSTPGQCRRTRTRQYLMVQQRPVAAGSLSRALYSGYGGLLPHNAHPLYALWLEMDPRQVDVNVHPTKREVRIANERAVRELLQTAVREALDMPETARFA
ncbi:DNA mismatch repair endonuclease MutL, partial [Candidatus Latescibacterota bacterium]